jgi:hypothetical protein
MGHRKMALRYHDIIMTALRPVDNEVVDVNKNNTWERQKIHEVPLVRYLGKVTGGLPKMRVDSEVQTEGIAIPTLVRWLAHPYPIRERMKMVQIAA